MTEIDEMEPLRISILFDGETTMRWVAEAIERMLTETNAVVTLVVINQDSGLFSSGNVKRGKKYPSYAAFWLLRNLLINKLESGERYDDSIPISQIEGVSGSEWLYCKPVNEGGLWNELPTNVVEEVAEQSDIVFRRGFGLIRGDILTATEYGVLSYHHGDPTNYRGGPAGFWEFMNGEEKGGIIIQTLREELDAGLIQAYTSVDLSGCQSWSEIRRRLYNKSTCLLADAVKRIQSEGDEPIEIEDFGPVHHPPSGPELARYFVKELF